MNYNTICNYTQERAWVTHPFVWWDNLFNKTELDRMVAFFNKEGTETAKLGTGKVDTEVRISDIKFHDPNPDTGWIFERFNAGIKAINDQFYGFELNGYDRIQYGEYHAKANGKYDWHMDMGLGPAYIERSADFFQTRKLSLSLLLNEPGKDFEGGELEFNTGNISNPATPETCRARIIAFPTFVIHRVKPVTKGTRKSLVIWINGPKFK
jgi:PKHD-type hydroxylase